MSKIAHWRFDIPPTDGVIYDECGGASGLTATWNTTPPDITSEEGRDGVRVDGTQWGIISGSHLFDAAVGITIIANIKLDADDQAFAQIAGFNTGSTVSANDNAIFVSVPSLASRATRGTAFISWRNVTSNDETRTPDMRPIYEIESISGFVRNSLSGIKINSIDNWVKTTSGSPASITVTNGRLLRSLYSVDGAIKGFVTDILIYDGEADGADLFNLVYREELNLQSGCLVFANQETKAQAWPGECHLAELISDKPVRSHYICKVGHFTAAPALSSLGYIAGIVTRQQVPAVGQRVLCFDKSMQLIAETRSGAGGAYRFDGLNLSEQYTILAQDNWSFTYAPVGADRRTPEAYS